MRRFWMSLWTYWALWVTFVSLIMAFVLDLLLTLGLYMYKGFAVLNAEVLGALLEIGRFWFGIVWSVTLLLALFMVSKRLFGRCYHGKMLQLLRCMKDHEGSNKQRQEVIDIVLLGDVVKLWRRWLMLLIWGVAAQVLSVVVLLYLLQRDTSLWEWFSVYWLYFFLMIAGYVTLPVMAAKCPRVKVAAC